MNYCRQSGHTPAALNGLHSSLTSRELMSLSSVDDSRSQRDADNQLDRRKQRNYKLLVDPLLKQGPAKVYRFEGQVAANQAPVVVRDPRSRARFSHKCEANLPVPVFKYDEHYVGTILPKEVTFCNLNNNINDSFLRDMCKNFGGTVEDVAIYYHPKTRRHLGVGTVVFSTTKAARLCAEKLHLSSKMGNIMTVFVDNMGVERRRQVEELSADKPPAATVTAATASGINTDRLSLPNNQAGSIDNQKIKQSTHLPLPYGDNLPHSASAVFETALPFSSLHGPLEGEDCIQQQAAGQKGTSWPNSMNAVPLANSQLPQKPGDSSSRRFAFDSTQQITAPPVNADFLSQMPPQSTLCGAEQLMAENRISNPLPRPPIPGQGLICNPLPPPPGPGQRYLGNPLPKPPLSGQGYGTPEDFDKETLDSPHQNKIFDNRLVKDEPLPNADHHKRSKSKSRDSSVTSSYSSGIGRACREAAAAARINPRQSDGRRNGNDDCSYYNRRHVDTDRREKRHENDIRDNRSYHSKKHDSQHDGTKRSDYDDDEYYRRHRSRNWSDASRDNHSYVRQSIEKERCFEDRSSKHSSDNARQSSRWNRLDDYPLRDQPNSDRHNSQASDERRHSGRSSSKSRGHRYHESQAIDGSDVGDVRRRNDSRHDNRSHRRSDHQRKDEFVGESSSSAWCYRNEDRKSQLLHSNSVENSPSDSDVIVLSNCDSDAGENNIEHDINSQDGTTSCGDVEAEPITMPVFTPAPQSLEMRISAILAQSTVVPFLSPTRSDSPPQAHPDDISNCIAAVPPVVAIDGSCTPRPTPPAPSESGDSGIFSVPYGSQQPLSGSDDTPSDRLSSHVTAATPNDNEPTVAPAGAAASADVNGCGIPVAASTTEANDDDDDRMSLSSLSSGDEKLEVIAPADNWPQNSTENSILHSLQKPFAVDNVPMSASSGGFNCGPPANVDLEQLNLFKSVIDRVMEELRVVVCRDMRKKMVELTGFKFFENWVLDKSSANKSSSGKVPSETKRPDESRPAPGKPFEVTGTVVAATSSTSSNTLPPTRSRVGNTMGLSDMNSMSLASLFEQQDSGQFGLTFGSGGLLGLRGAMPKMPSFRKKCLSPVRVEADDDDDADDAPLADVDNNEQKTDDEENVASDDDDDEDDEDDNKRRGSASPAGSGKGGKYAKVPNNLSKAKSCDNDSGTSDMSESEDIVVMKSMRTSKTVIYSSESEDGHRYVHSEDEEDDDDDKQSVDEDEDESEAVGSESSEQEDNEEFDVHRDKAVEDDDDDQIIGSKSAHRRLQRFDSDDEEAEADERQEESCSEDDEAVDVDVVSDDDDDKQSNERMTSDEEAASDEDSEKRLKQDEERAVSEKEETSASENEDEDVDIEAEGSDNDKRSFTSAGRNDTVSSSPHDSDADNDSDLLSGTEIDKLSLVASDNSNDSMKVSDILAVTSSSDESLMQRKSDENITRYDSPMRVDDGSRSKVKSSSTAAKSAESDFKTTLADISPTVRLERLDLPNTSSKDNSAVSKPTKQQSPSAAVCTNKQLLVSDPLTTAVEPTDVNSQTSVVLKDKTSPAATTILPSTAAANEHLPTLPPLIALDHCYCVPYLPDDLSMFLPISDDSQVTKAEKAAKPSRSDGTKSNKLSDVTNVLQPISRELSRILTPVVPVSKRQFDHRTEVEEMILMYKYLVDGADPEDIGYLQKRYEQLLQMDSDNAYFLNQMHWVEHPSTYIADTSCCPPRKKRKKPNPEDEPISQHQTGSARTEGYYKISHQEKSNYLSHTHGVLANETSGVVHSGAGEQLTESDIVNQTKKKVQQSREARSESRRWQSVLSSMGEDYGDLLKFNQLKFRKKQLKFARSGIHDWGLFALEPIAEGEMVIEYVGQMVRQSVADLREKRYEAVGIGSSYLFRVDADAIVDATRYGNLARFINHSCNPNCYAKIVTVESLKKIVIYSRRDINVNEEITYDYKFPFEDTKIPCCCGSVGCRGSLN